jgi:hypothetical protein
MILAHEKYPACSKDKCQDTTRSDESKLEEYVVGELSEESGVDHGESIIMQVEMEIKNEI